MATSKARPRQDSHTVEYKGPSGGWGSLRGIASVFGKEWDTPASIDTLMRQNKPHGFMCVSCSWAKPADHHAFEFCENGAKATLWELTTRRCTPAFFRDHTVSELRGWGDYDLEQQGRLTHPLRYNPSTDRYEPCSWDEAFDAIRLPDGCLASYYPEMNPLMALANHDIHSQTPAAKSVPVRISA